jgi:hypothetical protein
MHHSTLPMPSLRHHPIRTNDRYGPPGQPSMAGERSSNNVNREPRPSRSLRLEGNDLSMDYGPGSPFRSHIGQDPQRVTRHPIHPPSGMSSGPEEFSPYPPRHTYRCFCPQCIAVATIRLDREKAEREKKQSRKIAARQGNRRSYNDEPSPSRYGDAADRLSRVDPQYEKRRPPLDEPHCLSEPPLSPLIPRPISPQSINQTLPSHNIDPQLSHLVFNDGVAMQSRRRRPDAWHQHLESRRRARELLPHDFDRRR